MSQHRLVVLLVLLFSIASVTADTYLVLCSSNVAYAPWGNQLTQMCSDLSAQSVFAKAGTNPYVNEKAVINLATWQWGSSTAVGSKASLNEVSLTLQGTLPPQVLLASLVGQSYLKAFLVVVQSATQDPKPVALWELGTVYVTSTSQALSSDITQNWSLSLNFDQLKYNVWTQDATGLSTLSTARVCWSQSKNKQC